MKCSTPCFSAWSAVSRRPVNFYILTIRLNPGKEILTAIKARPVLRGLSTPSWMRSRSKLTGLEVLMRWKHPVMGEIPPDAFINFAEAQKLIVR